MLTDREVIKQYREWSEERYCAGFMTSSPKLVMEFREWLSEKPVEVAPWPLESYERDMLVEYRCQEVDDGKVAGQGSSR